MVRVGRPGTVGPLFYVRGGGAFSVPIMDVLSLKFGKTYVSSRRVELLAYFDTISAMPDEIWLTDDVKSFIRDNLARSPFKRVWLFDRKRGRILHVHPESPE